MKSIELTVDMINRMSPSVWRVWIEMHSILLQLPVSASPSVWRVWIEMSCTLSTVISDKCHPPCGGCGLKYSMTNDFPIVFFVTLRVEGVD